MSKYNTLWNYFKDKKEETIILTYEDIQNILGFPIDHSFLNYKKELKEFGYEAKKISMKEKKIIFIKTIGE
ncbi:MAG: hypothetical protein PHN72_05780 [Bacilli bacterium]|nr:hypothetical protein [Bacilli bacterium]